jgi:hypothetical protein
MATGSAARQQDSLLETPVDIAALVDECGELKRRIDLVKPDQARLKVVQEELDNLVFDLLPAHEPVTLEGHIYKLLVSPRENQTTINDIAEVRRSMSAADFLKIATVTLKALKTAVSESRFLSLVTTARTGNRTIKAVLKTAAE